MWKWIFIAIVLFFLFMYVRGKKTGNQDEYYLMGSLMIEQLPVKLQEELKKFCHEPTDLSSEIPNIPDHYIVGQDETVVLKEKYPEKYNDLKNKGLILTLDFDSGHEFETAYSSSIQNQDKCGSCWAFACTYSLTSRIRLYSRRGKSRKYFCYQGSETNPSECEVAVQCASLGQELFQRLRGSEWVEVIDTRKTGSCIPLVQYENNGKCYDYPSCGKNQRRVYNEDKSNIDSGYDCVDEKSARSTFPIKTISSLPDLFVDPMLWFYNPDENSNYELLKTDKATPGQTRWIYNCLSPYFLAGCNITEIAWELDPSILGSIQDDLRIKINDINKQMNTFVNSNQFSKLANMNNICFGGIPLYACIYLMLQGCTSLKSHNPFKRYENYKKCLDIVKSKSDGYEECQRVVKSFNQAYPSNRGIESRLRILYGCEDCDSNEMPYYSSSENCIIESDGLVKSLYDQYYCCKRVYTFNRPGMSNSEVVNSIKRDMIKYGAVVFCIDVKTDFDYNGTDKQERLKYYNKPYMATGRPSCGEGICGHAIVGVGWTRTRYGDAWICKNSWGDAWGNKGHFLLGIDKFISQVVGMEPFDYYDPDDFIVPTSIQQQIKSMTVKNVPWS